MEEEHAGGLAHAGGELFFVDEGEAELGRLHAGGDAFDPSADQPGVRAVAAGEVGVGQPLGEPAEDQPGLVAGQGIGEPDQLLGVQPQGRPPVLA